MLTDLVWFLRGKKTVFLSLGMILVSGAFAQGYITDTTFKALMALLGSGTAMALHAAISRGAGK